MSTQPFNPYDPRWQPNPSSSGPHPSHDSRYLPLTYPPFPPPTNLPPARGGYKLPDTSPNTLPMPSYRVEQRVSARITTDTWVMGIIISIVHIYSKLTGRTYLVEFESIDGSGRRERREFSDEELMPIRGR